MSTLSVVIPAYNEEKDIKDAVLDVTNVFSSAEIIVVNDASTDKTSEIIHSLKVNNDFNLKVITNEKNMGHGYSVIKGLREATGDYILYIDADRQIDVKYIKQLEGDGYEFVSGWRINRQDKPFRKVISFCLKMTNLIFHHYYIRDANCPFKLYRRELLLPLLDQLPDTFIVPIACLEVLLRKNGYTSFVLRTPHKPYNGKRKGFLQVLNMKTMYFFWSAFKEVVSL